MSKILIPNQKLVILDLYIKILENFNIKYKVEKQGDYFWDLLIPEQEIEIGLFEFEDLFKTNIKFTEL